jgi:hypothetical protein
MTFGEPINQSDYAIKRDLRRSLNIGVQSPNYGKMDPPGSIAIVERGGFVLTYSKKGMASIRMDQLWKIPGT